MTSRERIMNCYFHREVDRPPFDTRTLFPEGDSTYDEMKAFMEKKGDLMRRGINTNLLETQLPVERTTQTGPDGFLHHTLTIRTPKGTLTAEEVENLPGEPAVPVTHFVKSREDAEAYLSLPMPKVGGDVEPFFAADRKMGDRGVVEARLGANPAGFAADLCGSELFAMLSVTDRDLLHVLCERRMNILLNRIRFLHAKKVGPIFTMLGQEMVVPPLHGPQDYRDFNVKYDKPVIDLIHEGGGRVHIHCHGDLEKVLADIVAQGTDVLHPFEGEPTSRLTPKKAKQIARGKMCLHGNIQVAKFYECSIDEIRAETKALIRDVFDDRQDLILAPSASPYIHGQGAKFTENFKAMAEVAMERR